MKASLTILLLETPFLAGLAIYSEKNSDVRTRVESSLTTGKNIIRGNNGQNQTTKIETGDYYVKVRIDNTVDGEKLSPVEIRVDSDDPRGDYSIEKENDKSKVEVKVKIDGETVGSKKNENIKNKVNAKNNINIKSKNLPAVNGTSSPKKNNIKNINETAQNENSIKSMEVNDAKETKSKEIQSNTWQTRVMLAVQDFFNKIFRLFSA